ncbi:MAG: radical SAM protein [Deltaproteobacteria bacterium]|nr:MAG: radical SAM protein [Deltaproteobacteria bacterium]
MKQKPLIIPVFVPHEGCRHRCVYCDQVTISGVSQPFWSATAVRRHIGSYFGRSSRHPVEVAFYGGSFTLLPRSRQLLLLEAVQDCLKRGQINSVRISTRPDAIEADHLGFLRAMGVKTIEIGVQSLSDRVLSASARGHTSKHVYEAMLCLQQHGFEGGLQLMPGLPSDSRDTFLRTVDQSIALRPNCVRLYPTIVLAGTQLDRLYRRGRYEPLALAEAVEWCKEAKQRFAAAAIPVIRMGLQATASLEQPGHIVAGPYHPAFGQLVSSAIWRDRMTPLLKETSRRSRRLVIHAQSQELADIRGHRNGNLIDWVRELQLASLKTVQCPQTGPGQFRITIE